MYGTDFFERLDMRNLCAYLRTGEESRPQVRETLEERARKLECDWYSGLDDYRDAVLETDWTSGDRAMLTERLVMPLEDLLWEAEELAFEAGLRAGARLALMLCL